MFYHIGIPKISVEDHINLNVPKHDPIIQNRKRRPKSEVQKPRVLVSNDLTKSDSSCHSGFDTICDTCHVIYLFAMNFGICIVSHGIFPMCQFQNSFFHIFIWWWLKLQPILTLKLYCKRLLIHGLRNMNSFELGLRGTLHQWNVLVPYSSKDSDNSTEPWFRFLRENPKVNQVELENILNLEKLRHTKI